MIDKEDYLSVTADAEWLHTNISKDFFDEDYHRIIEFYVLHSPCKESSYSPRTFKSLGWGNIWKSSIFRSVFDSVPGFVDGDTFRHSEAKIHFLEMWRATGWSDFFDIEGKEFAVLIYAGESNPRMDMFHHIRNAFAHGRFSAKRINGEFYIYLEDVNKIKGVDDLCVNARICIKKSTLIEWLDIFEKKNDTAKALHSLYI